MGKTSIEWTDESKNPIRARHKGSGKIVGGYNSGVGHYCEKVSPGCKNCYSSATQPRFGLPVFQEQRGGDIEPFLDADVLASVLRRKTPTKFFWCDMTDMFGSWVPNEWIAACFGVMAATPQHTHQILTKRADRMREWFEWFREQLGPEARAENILAEGYADAVYDGSDGSHEAKTEEMLDRIRDAHDAHLDEMPWPLPNVWLGVSVEDQQRADERIPELLATSAAVRFISAEPLLGPVNLHPWLCRYGDAKKPEQKFANICEPSGALDWVIVGGESGAGARPFDLAWARSIVGQCKAAEVPVFFKQAGGAPFISDLVSGGRDYSGPIKLRNKKGGDLAELPEDLRVREFPR